MNKKGLVGKILLIVLAIFLIIGIYIGFTAYQAYSTIKSIQAEQPLIEADVQALQQGDCSKIEPIETRISNIKAKAESSCKNPLINYIVKKIEQIPIKCDNLSSFETQMTSQFAQIKSACANQTAGQIAALI